MSSPAGLIVKAPDAPVRKAPKAVPRVKKAAAKKAPTKKAASTKHAAPEPPQ